MKDTLKMIESKIKKQEDLSYFNDFITDFKSREERHYCAYLFSWLITEPNAIKTYFEAHTNKELIEDFDKINFEEAKVYYEYTGLRELLDLMGRKLNDKSNLKKQLKSQIENQIFDGEKGDIQKKKPDLVFYFPKVKTLLLVEAKFEEGFKEDQNLESQKYGDVLETIFPNDIEKVAVSVLGADYYVNKIKSEYPSISWEKIHEILPEGNIKNEIKRGLDYQAVIHPKAMANWKK